MDKLRSNDWTLKKKEIVGQTCGNRTFLCVHICLLYKFKLYSIVLQPSIYIVAREFCLNTTIHGLRYVAEPKRHWTERIWWLLIFSVSLLICIQSTINLWNDWNERPIIIGFDDQLSSIDKVNFPAITICPAPRNRILNYVSKLSDLRKRNLSISTIDAFPAEE